MIISNFIGGTVFEDLIHYLTNAWELKEPAFGKMVYAPEVDFSRKAGPTPLRRGSLMASQATLFPLIFCESSGVDPFLLIERPADPIVMSPSASPGKAEQMGECF